MPIFCVGRGPTDDDDDDEMKMMISNTGTQMMIMMMLMILNLPYPSSPSTSLLTPDLLLGLAASDWTSCWPFRGSVFHALREL